MQSSTPPDGGSRAGSRSSLVEVVPGAPALVDTGAGYSVPVLSALPPFCDSPKKVGARRYRCGKCRVCKWLQSQERVRAMLLEAQGHGCKPIFGTLTYDDAHLPMMWCDFGDRRGFSLKGVHRVGTLRRSHWTGFVKRLRTLWDRSKLVEVFSKQLVAQGHRPLPDVLRISGKGEYGEKFARPHYHFVVYNVPASALNVVQKLVWEAWKIPDTETGEVSPACNPRYARVELPHTSDAEGVASYVANYFQKMVHGSYWLCGREPEFFSWPTRGGALGKAGLDRLVEAYKRPGVMDHYLLVYGDAPPSVPIAHKRNREGHATGEVKYGVLGRRLRDRFREAFDLPEGEEGTRAKAQARDVEYAGRVEAKIRALGRPLTLEELVTERINSVCRRSEVMRRSAMRKAASGVKDGD